MVRWFAGLLLPFSLQAQFTYSVDQSIPVEVNGASLLNPWAGGLNAPQFSTMDLNEDGKEDLVLFDKTTSKLSTFLSTNGTYRYAPEYEVLFPAEISTFFVLRDFNCDGKKDLFTFGQIGVLVFRNETQPGKSLTWKKLSFYNPVTRLKSEVLLTTGFSGKINLLPGNNDLPEFIDMDGDGDLDVLNMRFVSPSTAEYHKNFSMERYGVCDSLDLERQTQNWGGFEECSCGKIAFNNQDCADIGGRVKQIEHTGGKALLAFDFDNDGDKDVLYSEEACNQIYYLANVGTNAVPVLSGLTAFPSATPVTIDLFPSPYMTDVDFDGKPDLIATPNIYTRATFSNDFKQSIWFYKNNGTVQLPSFSLVKKNLLQEDMIDLGDMTAPAFLDIDQDGDEDLFIGKYLDEGSIRSSVSVYENVGTSSAPSFKFVTDDFLSLSFLGYYNFKPQFADMDGNGGQDLLFTAINYFSGRNNIYFIPSSSNSSFVPAANILNINITLNANENVTAIDIDNDGHMDLLVGTATGALRYYRNTGTANQFVLANSKYLDIGDSPLRQNISAVAGDLDADGYEDLVIGDQTGRLSVYSNFRSAVSSPSPITDLIYNPFTKSYGSRNLGGKLRPVIVHLMGSNRPEIVVGNYAGGLSVLKNDAGGPLSDEPTFTVFPNPVASDQTLSIKADRTGRMDIFTVLGQRIETSIYIPANQILSYALQGLSPGIYIARFTAGSTVISRRFIIL